MTADNVLFEIKGLKKNFGDLEVLKGIHTTIRKGEVGGHRALRFRKVHLHPMPEPAGDPHGGPDHF